MRRPTVKFTYIEKVKDLNSCKDHHAIRSNIDGHSYNDDENADNVQVRSALIKQLYHHNHC